MKQICVNQWLNINNKNIIILKQEKENDLFFHIVNHERNKNIIPYLGNLSLGLPPSIPFPKDI